MGWAGRVIGHALVLLLAAAIFFAQGPQFVHHLGERVADPGDSLLNSWILAWDAHALATPGARLWDAPIYYPVKNTLAFSEVMFGNLWATLPVQYLTGNPTLAFNVLVFTSFVLGMYCTFLLVRSLTGSFAAGVASGVVFSFNPYRWSEVPHVQLLPFFWAPLTLLFADRFLRQPRLRFVAGMVVTLLAQYYASIYLGTILFITTGVFCLVHALAERKGKDRFIFVTDRRILGMLVGGAAVGAVALAPLAAHYLRTTRDWDFVRTQSDNASFSCELLSFFVPNATFRSYAWLPGLFGERIRGFCGLGIVPWALAFAGLLWARRLRERVPQAVVQTLYRFGWTALVMAVFMLGPCLILLNRQYHVPLPYFVVYHLVPGAKGMRVPTRFIFPLLLCLSVMGGYAVAYVASVWRSWRPGLRVAVALAFGLVLCWDYSVTNTPGAVCESRERFPAVYDYLASSGRHGPVLELPAPLMGQFRYLYYQTAHWRPLVGGETGSPTGAALEMAKRTAGLPTEECLRFLSLTPAGTLVVHLDGYPLPASNAWRGRDLNPYGFRFAGRFGDALVWERTRVVAPCSGKLRVKKPAFQVGRGLLQDRLDLSLDVCSGDDRLGWRYLDRGLGEICVLVEDAGGKERRYAQTVTVPAYLLGGETAELKLRVRGAFRHARRIWLGGPWLEDHGTTLN